MTATQIPVIVAIGEVTDRPVSPADALEPVALMAVALRKAEAECGCALAARIDRLDLVGQVTWRYTDPVALLCSKLGIAPPHAVNASMGGETPIRLIHEAALRIARGEADLCAIVGGEAMHARGNAEKSGIQLDWTPEAAPQATVQLAGSRLEIGDLSRRLGAARPLQLYPLYEIALQHRLGQTPAEGAAASAALWASYAAVASANPYAWIRSSPSAAQIGTVTAANRLIAWPYPKLMVANPIVNQGSAIILTSVLRARALGIPDSRLVHLWGGAAAREAGDYLLRDRYDRSAAQDAVLRRAVEIAGGTAAAFDFTELYSCFPVVPKMALQSLQLRAGVLPSVAGGITFFGGPMNNYMSHAVCAMVRRLRATAAGLGLVYGQGGFVDKHHALVLSKQAPPTPLPDTISIQAEAEALQDPAPAVIENYQGPASVETGTVFYDRGGNPSQGIVVARTPLGARLLAGVQGADRRSVDILTSLDRSPVGAQGSAVLGVEGLPMWQAAPA